MSEAEETRALIAAMDLLLSNCAKERSAIDQREADLKAQRAALASKLASLAGAQPAAFAPAIFAPAIIVASENEPEYGGLRNAVEDILRTANRKLTVADIAAELERRKVPTSAKNYATSARNALRILMGKELVKQQPVGRYRYIAQQ